MGSKIPAAILSVCVSYMSVLDYTRGDHEIYPLIIRLIVGIMYLLATLLYSSSDALAYHLALLASTILFTSSTGPAIETRSNVQVMLSALGGFGILWVGLSWYFTGPVWEEKQSPFAREWYKITGTPKATYPSTAIESPGITGGGSINERKNG